MTYGLPGICKIGAFALALAGPALADDLRIGTEADYAPYMLHDESGALAGFDKDLGDMICQDIGSVCTWVEMPFTELLPALVAGDVDLVMGGLAINPGRLEIVDFTVPYLDTGRNIGIFAGLVGGPQADPETATIAVLAGSNQEAHLVKTGRQTAPCPAAADCIAALQAGQADLVFSTGSYFLSVNSGGAIVQEVAREEFPSLGTAIAVQQGDEALRDRLSGAITAMLKDGRIDRLIEKWFPA